MFRKIGIVFLVLGVMASLSLAAAESGKQTLVKIGNNIVVAQGAEVKTAVAVGGSVTVYGKVLEDAVAVGGSVNLGDTALVGGDVVSVGGAVKKAPGAVVKGDITEVAFPAGFSFASVCAQPGYLMGLGLLSLLGLLGVVVFVIILVALFTPQIGLVSGAVEKKLGLSFLAGLLVIILFVPVVVLLAVSIIGIVFIPVWLLLVLAAMIIGYVAVAHLLGKKILYAFKIRGKSMMVETLSGLVVLVLASLMPVIGVIFKLLVVCCGLGAAALTRLGTVKG